LNRRRVPFEALVLAEPSRGIKVAQIRASKRFSTISAHLGLTLKGEIETCLSEADACGQSSA
jgi:hypothetical protein